ncbi:DUF3549 family protein [Shewanella surugensis]|uniref:DUF3549 family protein n=1 Tax=Shewanella surugensis TaxID=212020 RepID=A0ABT0LG57_9GAMM|nr:DUF3549 family protein [Shewanella surugensis]MCL1126676.1 DUF3549 family protein [Shewanella surugensis]
MDQITTLSQFLSIGGSQFHVYEMGRRVQHIDTATFEQIEVLKIPYPSPLQGHAHFALVFWDETQDHFIWFLKLPLDEQGLLSPAPRSQFIKMVIEALGSSPTRTLTESQQDKLANHPFSFKPTTEKLAIFNALVRQQLGQAPSSQYQQAYDYLASNDKMSAWKQVGLQGLADICVRPDEKDHLQLIQDNLSTAPNEIQVALCQCLEHLTIAPALAHSLLNQIINGNNNHSHYLFRALASHPKLSKEAIVHWSQQSKLTADLLITIAARNWAALEDTELQALYLEALSHQDQVFFNQLFIELVAIPSLRPLLLTQLRNPDRSEKFTQAIGGLFKVTKS